MRALSTAIAELLRDDPDLSALLGSYRGEAAVFTFVPVPPDADLPFVVVEPPSSDAEVGSKTRGYRSIVRAVSVYTEASGSARVVEEIAERVRDLLNRTPLVLASDAGWRAYLGEASGPTLAPTDDTMYGRRVTIRIGLSQDVA